MKKYSWLVIPLVLLIAFFIYKGAKKSERLTIIRPLTPTVFPKDMAPPAFIWTDNDQKADEWMITFKTGKSVIINKLKVTQKICKPSRKVWNTILASDPEKVYTFAVRPYSKGFAPESIVTFTISADPVDAAIFFRSVPLPFKFARENMKNIKWCLGDVGSDSKPHAVLQNMPVCANCHSFSADGKEIAMDVDAIDDKGAYVSTSLRESTIFASDSIMSWSKFQMRKFTYGLLSQISPDGCYVVSALHDCEIFVDQKDLEYSQLFFPFKGILEVYDRKEKRNFELPGANETTFVHSNPCWTPDGKNILFTRARAKHYNESGILNRSVPRKQDEAHYKKYEKSYLDRDSLFKFDIYTIPFNNGMGGGKATPIEGASNNGLSNYFPKVSPDGKWLFFSSKALNPYTQLFLTHINEDGTDTPPVYLDNFSFDKFANNIPEFANEKYNKSLKIEPDFLSGDDFLIRNGEIYQSRTPN